MAGPYEQAPQQAGSSVSEALQKQIGPLKAWQWGVAIGGAGLLFLFIRGRSSGSSSTTTTVPFTSDTSGDPSGVAGSSDNPIHTIVDNLPDLTGGGSDGGGGGGGTDPGTVIKKLLYTSAKVLKKAPIVDARGKVVGHVAQGRTLALGSRLKVNGKWLYPILNMPGKYVGGGSNFHLTPVYTNAPAATTGAISNAIASPALTLESSAAQLYQPATGTDDISPPSAANGYQLTAMQTTMPTISH